MSNLQEKIAKLFPEASFEDAGEFRITVPDARLHDLVKTLRDDSELRFDYLVTIVGIN